MKFGPFKMAQFTSQWPAGSLINMHSSNPQPLGWDELEQLTGKNLLSSLADISFGYESIQGNPKLREQLSHQYHSQITGNDLVLTSGAQEGIFLAMNALLNANDHVVTFTPGFEPLITIASNIGAQVTTLPLNANDHWRIDWNYLEDAITDNTKLVIINFPHNPTGTHITEQEMMRLIELCHNKDCWLFSDEVFRGLEHDQNDRIPSAADLYAKAVAMGVMSKSLALPGIRLGWLACQNSSFNQQIMNIKSHLSICQSAMDAKLCQEIIPYSEIIWRRNLKIILKNKQTVNQHLSSHPRFYWQAPKASATGFIQLKKGNAWEYTTTLANEHKIQLMPNDVFKSSAQGFRLTIGQLNSDQYFDQIMKF